MNFSSIEEAVAVAEQRWSGFEFRITGSEAHGACPICGKATEDGFIIWDNGRFLCRPGGCEGWLDDDQKQTLTKEEIRLRKMEAAIHRHERKQREHERRLGALEIMARCHDHETYNSYLDDEDRAYWVEQGFFPENIDRLKLGICYSCPTDREGHRASYTLPIYRRDGKTLWNISHRLIGTSGSPLTSGRYRPHVAGLGKQLARSHILDSTDEIILVEGSKKAAIISQYGFPTLGLQGCSGKFPGEWVEWMQRLRWLWVAFDPDANDHGARLGQGLAKALPHTEVRVCAFSVKPDDLFARYGGTAVDFQDILSVARKA